MADDSTLTIQFDGDTSGFSESIDQVQRDLQRLVNDAGGVGEASRKASQQGEELFKTLEKSSDTALAGIIKGTESWQQAMFKVFQDLEIKFAQILLNLGLQFARTQVQNLTSSLSADAQEVASNQAKNDAITASNQAAASTSATSRAAQVIKNIESDAAAAYSGVYAYMSPVLGPAAAIPAAAAFASVAAMEGLVSLDVGAWNLGSDMVAQLHQGEMVVPQTFAQGLRDGAGLGGGDNYTININAIDTQTGTQFLRNNANQIASIISGQVRNFNSNLPAWKS